MQINLSLSSAEVECRRLYPGKSQLLPKRGSGDRPNDPGWWPTNPKPSNVGTPRHESAVAFYLWLARHSDCPENCFPAIFQFREGQIAKPDKGVVKAFLAAQYLVVVPKPDGLLFELTAAGRSWYNA